jgi:hypothetical protein
MSADVKMRRRHHAALARLADERPSDAADIEELRLFMVTRVIKQQQRIRDLTAENKKLRTILDTLGIEYS